MKRPTIMNLLAWLLLFGLSWTPAAFADPDDDLEDTMMVVEEGATPEDIVNVIQLPSPASAVARENIQRGASTADQARDLGREFGRQVAEDAKTKGLSEQIRDDMQQNQRRDAHGDNGRSQRPDGT